VTSGIGLTLMPEYRCRTITYLQYFGIPAFAVHGFSTSYSKDNTTTSRLYGHFPLPSAWTCRRCNFHHHYNQQYRTYRVSLSTLAEWTFRLYPIHHKKYGRAECITVSLSTTSGMDFQGISISTASDVDMQGSPLSTTSCMDVHCRV
jgi:hypothetical protein